MRTDSLEKILLDPPEDHTDALHERIERECWKQHFENFNECSHPACVLLKRLARAVDWDIELNGISKKPTDHSVGFLIW